MNILLIFLLVFLAVIINYILIIPFAYAYDEIHRDLWYRAFFFLNLKQKSFIAKNNFYFGVIGFTIVTILLSVNESLLKKSNKSKCPVCCKYANPINYEKDDLFYYSNYHCNDCKSNFSYNFVYDKIGKLACGNLVIIWHNDLYKVYIGDFYNIRDKLFESDSFDESFKFFKKYNENLVFI